MVHVFVSYSHEDEAWVKRGDRRAVIPWLQEALRRDVEFWSDGRLPFGSAQYRDELEARIRGADAAVLLLSQDFLMSDFIREVELPLIQERYEAGRLTVIPIIVGHLSWDGYDDCRWLSGLQIIPGRPTPLITYVSDAAEWGKVKVEILDIFRQRLVPLHGPPTRPAPDSARADMSQRPAGRSRSRTTTYLALLALVALIVAAVAAWRFAAPAGDASLHILNPYDGDYVAHRLTVSVTSTWSDANPWIVVRPEGIDSFWVQAPLIRTGPRVWQGEITLGEGSEDHAGVRFQIRAFALPARPLAEGLVLYDWPESAVASPPVTVVRE